MRKWLKPGIVVIALLIAAGAFYARGRDGADPAEAAPEFEVAERRSLEVTAEASGQVEPIRLVEVKSKASGEIMRLRVESGDAVRRGDLLAEVDPRDVRNAMAQAEADLEVARARLTTAEAQKRRSVELREANVITEQEFESTTFEEANARAQFVKARVSLELAQERLNDVIIRAPIDGVIIRKDVEEGQIIQSASQNISGGTTVLVMADLSEMQVRALVNETELGKIQPGMPARVSVEAFAGRTFEGMVTKIEPQAVIEQNVTMFPVLVRLANADGSLKPGMNAEVVVEVARRTDVVTVPNAAVVASRDAMAAGALFGFTEEQMRASMRGARAAGNAAPGTPDTGTPAGARADAAARPQPLNGAAAPAAGAAAAGTDATAQARQQGTGGRTGQGNAQGGAAGARMGMGAGSARAGAGSDVRPGVLFVQTDSAVEARAVMLGVNDWDHTEVVRGLEPGERVILISVARLQAQQQEMLDRMRQRAGSSIMGGAGGGPGAGRGGR